MVHPLDGGLVLSEHDVPLDLERRSQLAPGEGEVAREDAELAHALGVGGGQGVGAVHAVLQNVIRETMVRRKNRVNPAVFLIKTAIRFLTFGNIPKLLAILTLEGEKKEWLIWFFVGFFK